MSDIWDYPLTAAEGSANPNTVADEKDAAKTSRTESPKLSEQAAASFREYNSLYSLWKGLRVGRFGSWSRDDIDLEYELDQRGIPKGDRAFFVDVKNYDQLNAALDYYEQDKIDKKILENSGFVTRLVSSVVAGAADPINLIPVGGAFKFGSTVVRAAVEGSIIGLANASIRARTNNQFDAEDVATETIAAGISSGFFVGVVRGIQKIPQDVFLRTKNAVKELLSPVTDRWFEFTNGELMQATRTKAGIAKAKATQLVRSIIYNSPYERMRNSGDELIARVGKLLFRDRVRSPKGDEVFSVTAEEALNLWAYKEHKLAEEVNILREKFTVDGGTVEEFNRKLMSILNNTRLGRPISEYRLTDVSPHVASAAQKMHELFGDVAAKAAEHGVIPGTAKQSVSIKDKYVVTQELADITPQEFKGKVETGDFKKTHILSHGYITRKWSPERVYEKLDAVKDLLEREIYLNNPELSNEEINKTINRIVANITQNGVESFSETINTLPAWVNIRKSRVVAIQDELLHTLGVIDFDPVEPALKFWRGILVETELNKVAEACGQKNWNSLKRQYQMANTIEAGKKLAAEKEKGSTFDEAAYLVSQFATNKSKNLTLLNDVETLFRGNYGGSVPNWVRGFKEIQYASQAGQLALSMLSDPAMIMLRINAGRAMSRLVGGTRNAMIGIAKIVAPEKYGAWLDGLTTHDKTLIQNAFGFLDRALTRNRFADLTGAETTSGAWVSKYTGVNYITKGLKQTAAEEIYSNILVESLKDSNYDKKLLQQCGISDKLKKELADAFSLHGSINGNLHFLDPDKLSAEASDTIRAAVQTLVDQTFMTGGLGDVPLFLRKSVGSFFFMFKTYPFVLYNNMFLPLVRGDIKASAFVGVAAGTLALSTVRKLLSDFVNGGVTDFEDEKTWREIFDYSALSSFITDAAGVGYDVFNGGHITSATSPTLAWLQNSARTIVSLTKGRMKKTDWRRLRNQTPGVNFWWARPLTNPLLD